jgi:hypothetical protein
VASSSEETVPTSLESQIGQMTVGEEASMEDEDRVE